MISRQFRAFAAIIQPTINPGDQFRWQNNTWSILQTLNDGTVLCQSVDGELYKVPHQDIGPLRAVSIIGDSGKSNEFNIFVNGVLNTQRNSALIQNKRIHDYGDILYAHELLCVGDVISLLDENLRWVPATFLCELYDKIIGDIVIPDWELLEPTISADVFGIEIEGDLVDVHPVIYFDEYDLFVIVDKFEHTSSYNGADITYPVFIAKCITKKYMIRLQFINGFTTSIKGVKRYDFSWKLHAGK